MSVEEKPSLVPTVVATALALGVYAFGYIGLSLFVGDAAYALGFLPVVVAAMLGGARPGAVAGVALVAVDLVISLALGHAPATDLAAGAFSGFAAAVVGFTVGHYRDLGRRFRRELYDRQRAEAELSSQRRKAEAAAKLTAIGEMAGNIAHEVNNPMTVIVGHAQEMLRAVRRRAVDYDELERQLLKIKESAFRVSRIIGSLRSFMHETESEAATRLELRGVVGEATDICRIRLPKGAELRVRGGDLAVHARRTQVLQILVNLLNNACDAIEEAEERWIEVSVDRVEGASRARVAIGVKDSGGPLPSAVAAQLFTPFYTTKAAGKGTGLGLTISKQLAEKNGGDLVFAPEGGRTRFILTLPLDEARAAGLAA